MKAEISETIARLSAQTIAAGQEPYRSVATLTHGLPVYADVGGCVAITYDGNVVEVALDDHRVQRVAEIKWRRAAYAAAARAYPALAELFPERPADALTCDGCAGTGEVVGIPCGQCGTLGWTDDEDRNLAG